MPRICVRRTLWLPLAAIILAGGAAFGATETLKLGGDGRPATVIVAPGRSEPEQFAAAELARVLGRMAGCEFRVRTDAARAPRTAIRVGTSASLAPLIGDADLRERVRNLSGEAFMISVGADGVFLIGASPRSTLYAVYDLLEDDLGASWAVPGAEGESIPEHDPLVLKHGTRTEGPTFPLRSFQLMSRPGAESADGDAALIDWAAKRKLNMVRIGWCYSWDNVESRLLREIRKRGLMSGASNHAFGRLVPPEKYAQTHPEYYAVRDGQHNVKVTHLCTTNPDVVETAARELVDLTASHPELTHLGMLQGDGWAFCQCPDCQALIEGTCDTVWPGESVPKASGLILKFVNDLSRALKPERPDVSLWFEAYSPTIEPPATLRPDPDVNVFVWIYWRCCLHSLDDPRCTRSQVYADVLRGWRERTAGQMMVTDYWCGLTQPVPWWPTMTTMRDDYRFLHDLGIEGVETWGLSANWFKCADLSAYLSAELLWNLERSTWDIIDQYCRARYGAAGGTMVRYYREIARGMELAAAEHPVKRVANTWPIASMYVRDPAKLRRLIERAQAEADTDVARVGMEDAWINNEYTLLMAEIGAASSACRAAIDDGDAGAAREHLADMREAVDAFSAFFAAYRGRGVYYGTPKPLEARVEALAGEIEDL